MIEPEWQLQMKYICKQPVTYLELFCVYHLNCRIQGQKVTGKFPAIPKKKTAICIAVFRYVKSSVDFRRLVITTIVLAAIAAATATVIAVTIATTPVIGFTVTDVLPVAIHWILFEQAT